MKEERQRMILEIISSINVETQGQLLEELQSRGCVTTQATLSRDIKELRLTKKLGADGKYRYEPSLEVPSGDVVQRLQNIFHEVVTDCDIVQNLIVLKTVPGLASAACSALDQSQQFPDLVGSIAGDDTALLIMRSNENARRLYEEIKRIFR